MNRETVRVAVVALLAVVAIGFAAGTLTSTVDTGDDGDQQGNPIQDRVQGEFGELGNGTVREGVGEEDNSGWESIPGTCLPFMQSPLFLGGSLVGLAIGAVILRRRLGSTAVVFVLFTAFAPLAAILYGIFSSCGPPEENGSGIETNVTQITESATGGTVQSPPSPPLLVLGILLLTVAVLGGVLLWQSRGGVAAEIDEEDLEDQSETLEAIGETAGEAADRIENATGLENEVYRAWREMADLLDVERPETSTPGEFADAAVAAGMDPDDVSELTRLFEEVRYGDAPPTEDREDRAVAALRNIESEYGAPSADPEYDAQNREEGGER